MPPVQIWDYVQDPLDVDKKKTKKDIMMEADPYPTIKESDNE